MHGTKEYRAWQAIKNRCCKPTTKDFSKYGGCGIAMFLPWQTSFGAFFDCVGPAPSRTHQVDRINTLGHYEPGNVRWATPTEQQRNKKTSWRWNIKGVVHDSISDAARANNVSEYSIYRWCIGQFDERRGTFTPPRTDCTRSLKYVAE